MNSLKHSNPFYHRSSWLIVVTLAAAVILLAGCSTAVHQLPGAPEPSRILEQERQQVLVLIQHRQDQERLARIALPLQQVASEVCPNPAQAALGIRLANRFFIDESLRDSAVRLWQLGEALVITAVLPESPAEKAGLQAGDYLIQLNGSDFPVGEQAGKQLKPMLAELKPNQPLTLLIERNQQPLEITLTPTAACRYPLVLKTDHLINAYADNSRIVVTSGMLRFATEDAHLRFVIAHELAHNLLGHVPGAIRNGALGSLIDAWLLANGVPSPAIFTYVGALSRSQDFEREADYVALYLIAAAGYALDPAADYWRRSAPNHPSNIATTVGNTHPGSSDRYLAMQQTIAEIEEKMRQGKPLLPSLNLPKTPPK